MEQITPQTGQEKLRLLVRTLVGTRIDLGLRRKDVADALGVSTNSVMDWEAARCSLRLQHFILWADLLKTDVVLDRAPGRRMVRERDESREAYQVRKMIAALRQARRASGLRQQDVARIAGVGATTLRHWEELTSQPRIVGAIRWAAALERPVTLRSRR